MVLHELEAYGLLVVLLARLRFPQGKLLQPRQPLAPLQLGKHVGRLQPEGAERDHRVEPQVGHLVDELGAVAVLGRHHGLGGFLADLLEDRVQPLGVQPRDIALVGIGSLALLDHFGQTGERVVAAGHL